MSDKATSLATSIYEQVNPSRGAAQAFDIAAIFAMIMELIGSCDQSRAEMAQQAKNAGIREYFAVRRAVKRSGQRGRKIGKYTRAILEQADQHSAADLETALDGVVEASR